MPSKVEEASIDRLSAIREDNPYLFWRIVAIRNMIEHRGFTVKEDIAPEMGRSYENVYAVLRGSQYRFSWETEVRNNTSHIDTIHRTLDDIEAAITTLTEKAGSVYSQCGCTAGGIAVIKSYMGSSLEARRAFGEKADYDTD